MTATRTATPDNPAAVSAAIIEYAGGSEFLRACFKICDDQGKDAVLAGVHQWLWHASGDDIDAGHDDPALLGQVAAMATLAVTNLALEGRLP